MGQEETSEAAVAPDHVRAIAVKSLEQSQTDLGYDSLLAAEECDVVDKLSLMETLNSSAPEAAFD